MKTQAVSILSLLLLIQPAQAGAPFELGRIKQASAAWPRKYVVPVTVSADGYSTFSAYIWAEPGVMQRIRWQNVERESGVDVVITVASELIRPQKITLVAHYQGRQRVHEYWPKPVPEPPAKPVAVIHSTQEPERSDKQPVCPQLMIRPGSLYANVARLTVECDHRLGIWHPGDQQYLLDWRVVEGRLLDNERGIGGLLELLETDYGLLGVVRTERTGERTIDYHEHLPVQVSE